MLMPEAQVLAPGPGPHFGTHHGKGGIDALSDGLVHLRTFQYSDDGVIDLLFSALDGGVQTDQMRQLRAESLPWVFRPHAPQHRRLVLRQCVRDAMPEFAPSQICLEARDNTE